LPFSGRQAAAPRLQHRVQARREPSDPVAQAQFLQDRHYRPVIHPAGKEGEVVADRSVKHLHVLGHHLDPLPETASGQLTGGGTADNYLAFRRVIEPQEETGQGGLAAPRPAQEADDPAGRKIKIDVMEDDLVIVFIGKAHTIEPHRKGPCWQVCNPAIGQAGLSVKEFPDPEDAG